MDGQDAHDVVLGTGAGRSQRERFAIAHILDEVEKATKPLPAELAELTGEVMEPNEILSAAKAVGQAADVGQVRGFAVDLPENLGDRRLPRAATVAIHAGQQIGKAFAEIDVWPGCCVPYDGNVKWNRAIEQTDFEELRFAERIAQDG